MNFPFTAEEFLEVFEKYNTSVWPAQIIFYALALLTVVLTGMGGQLASKIVCFILGLLWLWMGVVYHIIFFTSINPMAFAFGGLFIAQGLIFTYSGLGGRIRFKNAWNWRNLLGISVTGYGLLIYPVLGSLLGHYYPKTPTLGVPCPTTIFTLGILFFTLDRLPRYVLIIPLLWSVVGFSAAMNLSIEEDFGLLVSGVLAFLFLFLSGNRPVLPVHSEST